MKIALAQLNLTVGALAANAAKIQTAAEQAASAGAAVLITPELSLCGYPPEDLLFRGQFIADCESAIQGLCATLPPTVCVLVGAPLRSPLGLFNACYALYQGKVLATYCKRELPNYAVFDEKRYFTTGNTACVLEIDGIQLGLLICEDMWFATAAAASKAAGAQALLVLNASPYDTAHHAARREQAAQRTNETGLPLLYCNLIGGQDELVFDGDSFVMAADGQVTQQLPRFKETLAIAQLSTDSGKAVFQPVRNSALESANPVADVYAALCLGVHDYIRKNRFPGIILGLSGGIDSAVVLAIAVDALGAENVRAVMLPSKYNLSISLEDARTMAGLMHVQYDEIDIEPIYLAFEAGLAPHFKGYPIDASEENLQSRIRGTLLMGLSNKTGRLVLTTGNKSEMTTGYATLYGDMAGGFGVLKDVDKEMVYALANYRNTLGRVIPERVITRPPSAELRHDQTDQDSLPPYDILDAIMALYVEKNVSPSDIMAQGFAQADVVKVVRLIKINEYKRRQAPVGPRVTPRAYGRDWRVPITSDYRDW
jgi:NAD+ synthase (glutamine-hydrolysing)